MQPASRGLAAYNFLIAAMQTGFGPFINLALIDAGWNQAQTGLALSIGTIGALVLQLPGGALVDAFARKRLVLGGATILTGLSALLFCVPLGTIPVFGAELVHAAAATVITPAIAAVTLAAFGHNRLSASLGGNTRWASLGSAGAALILGGVASWLSNRMVFLVVALMTVPAVWVLKWIEPTAAEQGEAHAAVKHPKQRKKEGHRFWRIYLQRHMHGFAICVMLFSLANGAMLPLAVNALAVHNKLAGLVISAAIIVSQLVVAAISPALGRAAERKGRRPILLLGFAALPIKGALLALLPGLSGLLLGQAMDGISGSVMGIMISLIAADLTRHTAFMNLAINSFALASGVGAAISTFAAGWLADRAGTELAMWVLTAIAVAALIALRLLVPETHPAAGRLPGHPRATRMRAQSKE